MKLTRRHVLGLTVGAAAFAVAGARISPALASVEDTEKAIMDFTGGIAPGAGKITLTAPEIAENGNTVPISVSVESAMEGDDLVESVILFADGNPSPPVATFHFTEMSGAALATTRMRLAKTQNVVAVAKMKDGSFFMDKKEVKVTIGGCGG
ncbi:MAG: thiosulfate oxidation carrier protein SoxY [Hoeflea sp.]|uniref:thiosulfate oxidation carrier protein SoxY n=1 Tax=Hoeflea sp. TaxID=1940281 RepID=UPI001D52CEA6|nr:thiosulfate oxidation carrier protein SoxY [Hoeflea sp.]MBU4528801.1 thiosulfate oxidation carrier protein SoxY [Alphaproteobacteria bacterium]MBU4545872.1 thiosulfate oxidation carrier protein SoxY [Alphaproteobacteria bacterium]MBU4549935.1 thiosulfate oxidation carrier protein SoxY [Alphaproteobacteria bacterium]MBV1725932.1 thiosulfate oxidation carrier protein SoxY [Hoeflea sp.]MBV1762657.1 thiosulfate oxidation carrier protein SoxY [Hoeflea sp.]